MTTELVTIDHDAAASAIEHILATGDLAKLTALEPRLDGPTEQIDDLHVQAPSLSLRAFLEGCVEVRWQANKRTDQLGHDVTPVPRNWYNSSTLVAECNYVDEVVVGEIRTCRDVGMKGNGRRVIGHACLDCGLRRWMLLGRGKRPLPTRCAPCQGRLAVRVAQASNVGRQRPDLVVRFRGANGPAWRGGRAVRPGGYIAVWIAPDDPFRVMAMKRPFVLEHRLVMARALGRPLARWEQVHHINGIRDDNRLENLELWKHQQPSGIRQADYHCPGCRCGEEDDR